MSAAITLTRALGPWRDRVADAAGLVAYATEPSRRRRTARNHRRLDHFIGEREARRRSRASYRAYARFITDFLWACGLDESTVLANSVVFGMEHVDAARDRGGILVLTHFGNWDMAASIAWANQMALSTVMAPVGPPAVTEMVVWARQRNQLEVFPPERAARGLVRALRRGGFVALLCDIPGAGPETVVDFCGGPVIFSTVPARLAMQTGADVLPAECRRGEAGEPPYVATVHPPVAVAGLNENQVMQRVADALEPAIRARPEQWYPFGAVYTD
jgi:phosphatidylinositol dimannoside acyltransferase